MSFRIASTAMALGLVAVVPAAAQTKAPPTSAPTTATTGGDNLTSKLSKSDGVIAPKGDIDPGMKVPAPAPHPNSTPVIPPSATGGNTAK